MSPCLNSNIVDKPQKSMGLLGDFSLLFEIYINDTNSEYSMGEDEINMGGGPITSYSTGFIGKDIHNLKSALSKLWGAKITCIVWTIIKNVHMFIANYHWLYILNHTFIF